ncbi:MAG: phage holin family protein, partial [Ilumatobacteraceae bacterium]
MADRLDIRTLVRPDARPRLSQILGRGLVVIVSNAVALSVLAALLDGFDLDGAGTALLAGAVIGVLNAVVWPAIAFLVVPLSVLTLGLGAIVINALVVGLALDSIPGVWLDGFFEAVVVTVGLTLVTTIVTGLLAIDDDAWFDQRMANRARRRRKQTSPTDVPGIVFVQIDGLAETVLRRSLASGDAPTLHRWLQDGSHRLVGWETQWSSQTGVS